MNKGRRFAALAFWWDGRGDDKGMFIFTASALAYSAAELATLLHYRLTRSPDFQRLYLAQSAGISFASLCRRPHPFAAENAASPTSRILPIAGARPFGWQAHTAPAPVQETRGFLSTCPHPCRY